MFSLSPVLSLSALIDAVLHDMQSNTYSTKHLHIIPNVLILPLGHSKQHISIRDFCALTQLFAYQLYNDSQCFSLSLRYQQLKYVKQIVFTREIHTHIVRAPILLLQIDSISIFWIDHTHRYNETEPSTSIYIFFLCSSSFHDFCYVNLRVVNNICEDGMWNFHILSCSTCTLKY